MTTEILALCGSLREQSYNRMALEHARHIAGDHGARISVGDISAIPLYNQDNEEQPPAPVSTLGKEVADADAVLIVSPEYNYSVPGVLKNALDWLSRLPDKPFANKPVAIMGCSMSPQGSGRMQYHLRQVLLSINAVALNKPEVMIGSCHEKFDDQGALTDDKAKEMIGRLLDGLTDWQRTLSA